MVIVGNCANCGVEYHIHTQTYMANLEAKNKELREALEEVSEVTIMNGDYKEAFEVVQNIIDNIIKGTER